nr:DUF917 domain-containing protein [Pseudonocardia acaciae]
MRLRPEDVDAFVVGLALLGSGGGGDALPYRQALRTALPADGLELHDPAALGDGPVLPVGMIGATRMYAEKLPGGQEIPRAVRALARWTGVEPVAVMPYEGAGLNGALATMAAAQLGLPLVDADLMGRALPRLDQISRAVEGGAVTPFAMCDPGGQTVLVDSVDPVGLERTARAFVAHGGGWAGTAMVAEPARALGRTACVGTLGRALRVGRAHLGLPEKAAPEHVAEVLGGRLLGTGRVADISRQRSASFGRASITVLAARAGRDGAGGAVLRLEAENEYLLVLCDGEPAASCPDLLCVLDRRTATPIAVDSLRPGDDVMVLALPGPPWWRESRRRLRRVGPRAFGLGCDPVLLPSGAGAGDPVAVAP